MYRDIISSEIKVNKYKKFLIFLLAFCTESVFLGHLFPHGLPLFSIVLLGTLIISVPFLNNFRFSLHIFTLYAVIPLFLYIFALALTGRLFSPVKYALIDAGNMTIYLILMLSIIKNEKELELYKNYFENMLFFSGVFFALMGLYKYMLLSNRIFIDFIRQEGHSYPWGTSLLVDYNVFSRTLIFALLIGIQFTIREKRLLPKIFYISSSIVLLSCILFTGSRRGILFSSIIIFSLILFLIIKSIKSVKSAFSILRFNRKKFLKISIYFLFCILLFTMLFSFVNQFFNDGAGNISVLNRAFTVFSALKSSEKVGGSFLESRIIRLKISVDIFSSYGLLEKLVGGGFGYLEEIAVVTGVDYDYPHNILVSVLLSNGILGLLC